MLGRIVAWLRGSDQGAQRTASTGTVRSGDPSSYAGHEHVLKGLRFTATLKLDTPLDILRHHGELHQGPAEDAPTYGGPADGIWIPEVDWDRVGLTPPPDATMWTPVGHVPPDGGNVLPFLTQFRKVVEGEGTTEEKIDALKEMMRSSPEFGALGRQFEPGFPESWFWGRLEQIPGVGEGAARRLFEAGFRDFDALRRAERDSLMDVPGVGPKTVERIRDFVTKDRNPQKDLEND